MYCINKWYTGSLFLYKSALNFNSDKMVVMLIIVCNIRISQFILYRTRQLWILVNHTDRSCQLALFFITHTMAPVVIPHAPPKEFSDGLCLFRQLWVTVPLMGMWHCQLGSWHSHRVPCHNHPSTPPGCLQSMHAIILILLADALAKSRPWFNLYEKARKKIISYKVSSKSTFKIASGCLAAVYKQRKWEWKTINCGCTELEYCEKWALSMSINEFTQSQPLTFKGLLQHCT